MSQMNKPTQILPQFTRLIEVALPMREISAESVRDKSLRHGHISTLHLWRARAKKLRTESWRRTRSPHS